MDRSVAFDGTTLKFTLSGDFSGGGDDPCLIPGMCEEEPTGMFDWVTVWPGVQLPITDPFYLITQRQFQGGDANGIVKVDFSSFNSTSYIQTYFRADVQKDQKPVITARDMRFVDNPTAAAVAPLDGAWNQGAFSSDAVLASIRVGGMNYGTVSILSEFDFATYAMKWEHRMAMWGSNGVITKYVAIPDIDATNSATYKIIADPNGVLMVGYTNTDGHAVVRVVDPETLAMGATLVNLAEVAFADLIYDNPDNYVGIGSAWSGVLGKTVGVVFGKKGGVDFFYEIPEIPGLSSFTLAYIIRDVNDGNLIVVGTGMVPSDDLGRLHGFVAKTTSATLIEFVWPPAEIADVKDWTIQFSPRNPASSDENWAIYNVPDNAFVFYGPADPRIFVDHNIKGYKYVATNSSFPDFSVLAEGEWSSWILDLSSIYPGLVLNYVVIVPADNSPVPVVSVTINRPAGVWMVGDSISFTTKLRNADDFVLDAPAELGCVKNADLTVTCTPTAVGTYNISAYVAGDSTKSNSITVNVIERVAVSISPSAVNLAVGQTQTFTVTKENTADFALQHLPGMGCVKVDSETLTCTPTFWVAGRTRDVVVMADQYISKHASASITVEALSDLPENFSNTYANGTYSAPFNMIYVQGGTYTRGRNAREDDEARGLPPPDQYESPEHEVTLSDFWIQDREVTGAMQRAAGGTTGSGTAPLVGVNWFEANQIACNLSNKTGRPYRMLSDAEWEFAAKGGIYAHNANTGEAPPVGEYYIYAGSDTASNVATYSGRGSLSAPPGTGTSARKANQLGIYDMSGNAFEWVYDWIESYTATPKVDPVMSMGMGNKTRRGGSTDEPAINARVSRRAIRSREGGAGMGMRLGYGPLPPGMETPCDAAASGYAQTTPAGDEFRDSRLVVGYDEVWASSASGTNTVIIRSDGTGSVANQRGSWFTVNDRVLYIVTESGIVTTYPYFLFNMNEMTVVTDPNGGLPTRYYRVPTYLLTSEPTEPVSTGASLAELVSLVPAGKIVPDSVLKTAPANKAAADAIGRDLRLVIGPDDQGRERRWFFDGNCCAGNHKYRFELRADGTAEFVVMDYDNGGTGTAAGTQFTENVLATTRSTGYWWTTGDVALHLYDGTARIYNNYLYTVGERTSGSSITHSPPTPTFTHVSMQSYERGDFRIFNGIIKRFINTGTGTNLDRLPLQEKEVAGTGSGNCTVGGVTQQCRGLASPGSGIYNYTFQDTAWPYGFLVRPYSSMSSNGAPVYTTGTYMWRSGQ